MQWWTITTVTRNGKKGKGGRAMNVNVNVNGAWRMGSLHTDNSLGFQRGPLNLLPCKSWALHCTVAQTLKQNTTQSTLPVTLQWLSDQSIQIVDLR